jgi:hypothetical protein
LVVSESAVTTLPSFIAFVNKDGSRGIILINDLHILECRPHRRSLDFSTKIQARVGLS